MIIGDIQANRFIYAVLRSFGNRCESYITNLGAEMYISNVQNSANIVNVYSRMV